MKSLFRRGTTLAVLGTTILGSLLIGGLQALALTQEQIIQKLAPVLVFTISNQEGQTLIREVKNQQNNTAKVAGIFMNQRDAQAFLDKIKSENPQLAGNMQVIPRSLADVYQLEQANQNKPDALNFAYVPTQQQLDSALAVLKQGGQNPNQFNGVPLFVVSGGPNKSYLAAQRGNQQIIPFFFSKEELQAELDRIKQQQPNLASTLQIEVVPLEGLIQAWKSQNEDWLSKIELIPPKESRELLRSLLSNQNQNPSQPGRPSAPAQNNQPQPGRPSAPAQNNQRSTTPPANKP